MILDIPSTQSRDEPNGSPENLENYLKKISDSPMFPAFSANIRELLGILEDPYYPVYEVSRVVLRDVSLTTQILKLVNSIFFQARHHQVHTISSAVMLMGFELVRDLAVGLMLFENFKQSASLDRVKQLMFMSFLMGLAAQELSPKGQRANGEELFLTALLYNFGELAAAYYFPEEYRRVLDLTREGHPSKADAVLQVFHFSLDDLGQSLLKTWNFPDTLRVRLAELKQVGWELPGPAGQRRRFFKGIDELSQALLNPATSPEKLEKLKDRMARQLGLQPEVMAQSMGVCLHHLQELAGILSLNVEDLGLSFPPLKKAEIQPLGKSDPEAAAPVPPGQPLAPQSPEPFGAPDQEMLRLNFLLQIMEEINQAVATRVPIHRVIMMILEGIYQGIGFDRVAFCMVDPQRTWITGRFGMGEGVDALLPLLKVPFASKTNPFSLSLAHCQEYLVGPEDGPGDDSFLGEEFWRDSGAQLVLVSPILIDAAPIGVIYLERRQRETTLSAQDRQRLHSFRDLAVIALRLSSQRGQ
jgi:HD-like signal output (HDOD) protein